MCHFKVFKGLLKVPRLAPCAQLRSSIVSFASQLRQVWIGGISHLVSKNWGALKLGISRGINVPSGFIKHGWLGNPRSMEVFVGKSLTNGPFSIAVFDCRRVPIEFNGAMIQTIDIDT